MIPYQELTWDYNKQWLTLLKILLHVLNIVMKYEFKHRLSLKHLLDKPPEAEVKLVLNSMKAYLTSEVSMHHA